MNTKKFKDSLQKFLDDNNVLNTWQIPNVI